MNRTVVLVFRLHELVTSVKHFLVEKALEDRDSMSTETRIREERIALKAGISECWPAREPYVV